ncbi:UNVERIFIED_CONTAM: hypothetical protein FKN15_075309 [Acipenser sinensis]
MYWSSNEGLRLDMIANAMPVNRFEEIRRYLHFADNYSHEPGNKDKLFKIQPVLDRLEASFSKAVDPEEFQSVDEQMISFKGHLSIKQYIPKKPKPWGLKVWVRAGTSSSPYIPKKPKPWGLKVWVRAGTSRYMYRFEVYQGTSGGMGEASTLGMCADVVLLLCDDIQNKNHKVFFDNLFCTIALLQRLRDQGIYATEHHLPSLALLLDIVKELERLRTAVKLYNKNMGGVDLIDQCVSMYPHRRKNRRWYIRVFFHFLDVTCVNAWLLYRMAGFYDQDLLNFKASIAQSLINAGSLEQR